MFGGSPLRKSVIDLMVRPAVERVVERLGRWGNCSGYGDGYDVHELADGAGFVADVPANLNDCAAGYSPTPHSLDHVVSNMQDQFYMAYYETVVLGDEIRHADFNEYWDKDEAQRMIVALSMDAEDFEGRFFADLYGTADDPDQLMLPGFLPSNPQDQTPTARAAERFRDEYWSDAETVWYSYSIKAEYDYDDSDDDDVVWFSAWIDCARCGPTSSKWSRAVPIKKLTNHTPAAIEKVVMAFFSRQHN